jgi:hypothetical protein
VASFLETDARLELQVQEKAGVTRALQDFPRWTVTWCEVIA